MRYFFACLLSLLIIFPLATITTFAIDEKQSIIIEVEGYPSEHEKHIETYHPFIEVIATYDKLFNGLALRATPEKLAKISSAEFIKAIHPVHTYEAIEWNPVSDSECGVSPGISKNQLKNMLRHQSETQLNNIVLPSNLNTTPYTGKGVKVAVIDTGIDYTHPDLATNYVSGYDLVDFDDDPMETTPEEGIPTAHGTHVAGIIAANGTLTGVAKDAELYGYRALGAGGRGTSIQVIAAMEQAVNDGVDIINLSLGNSINGPDFPTSEAVNKAVDLGIAVVIANGNDGPHDWTVGSPATATNALSVGATVNEQQIPFLHDKLKNKNIPLNIMIGSQPWHFDHDFELIDMDNDNTNLTGKIAITERNETSFYDKAKQAEQKGAEALLIYNNNEEAFIGSIEDDAEAINIPVASITKDDGSWLLNQMDKKSYYIDTMYERRNDEIASFSSRGPVTISWDIKPDILAPGSNVLSTVPNGYELLQGTSMAAPHVAGAIAVIKEANPHWTNEQIISSLKTTAQRLTKDDGDVIGPTSQGIGEIQLNQAIETTTLIDQPLLSFGKIDEFKETKTIELSIENLANKRKQFTFDIPKIEQGLTWTLPQTFTVEANSKKTVPVELHVTTTLIDEGMHEGWLTLSEQDNTYELPYLVISQSANYPKAMGFDFSLKTFSDDVYQYQVYVTEPIVRMDVQLFNPDTLLYERTFLHLKDLNIGMNEGEMAKSDVGESGLYQALITVQLADGTYESHEVELYID